MLVYTCRRLAATVPIMLGVATLVFAVLRVVPGDPVEVLLGDSARPAAREQLRARLGLDRPLAAQYAAFLTGIARGDLGRSIRTDEPVRRILARRIPATLLLAAASLLVAVGIGVPAGLAAASMPHGVLDRLCLAGSLLGVAIPNFWLGPMLVLVFSIGFGLFPVSGMGGWRHLVLPALTLGASAAGILARMTRMAVLEALEEDWIRAARAKGLRERTVIVKHALRAGLTPVLTVLGLELGGLLAGSVVTETIFAWPGLGSLTIEAIQARDYPVVQGCVLLIAFGYVAANLAADLASAWANPQVREAAFARSEP